MSNQPRADFNTLRVVHSAPNANGKGKRTELRTQQSLPQIPPPAPPPQYDPHNTYYEDGYLDANPWMWEGNDGPEFTLAGNFPRTLRWRPSGDGRGGSMVVEPREKGETEEPPQTEAAEEQRQEVHREEESEASTIRSHTSHRSARPTQPSRHASKESQTPSNRGPTHHAFNPWSVVRLRGQRPLAEWLGTTVFIFLGISANLSVTVSLNSAGTTQTEYWSWGFAVMVGIYIAGGGSGAFLNPAIIIMLSIFRGFPSRRIPVYVLAQVLGAFCGALLAIAIYYDSIMHLDGALVAESTGTAIYTQPRGDYIRVSTAFFAEVLGSAVVGCSILALGDSGNSPPGAGMHALIIGFLITVVTMSLSWTTRGCFNPARDLGPRLAAIAVGYPTNSFTAFHNWWIWGGWAAPLVGVLLGGCAYDLCIFKGGESPVSQSGLPSQR